MDQARTQLENLEWKLDLTRTHLHPAAPQQGPGQAGRGGAGSSIRPGANREQRHPGPPSDGNIVYKSLYVGGEYRTLRIGDTVFPNQAFMALPNMNESTVSAEVPEAELGRVLQGRNATIRLVAFPEIRLEGWVSSVGSIAQTPPGQPAWQRFFHVIIRLKSPADDPRVRPGMTVTVQILSYFKPQATLVPRAAVSWEEDRPWVRVKKRFLDRAEIPPAGKVERPLL